VTVAEVAPGGVITSTVHVLNCVWLMNVRYVIVFCSAMENGIPLTSVAGGDHDRTAASVGEAANRASRTMILFMLFPSLLS
jgi:hypothetical protein